MTDGAPATAATVKALPGDSGGCGGQGGWGAGAPDAGELSPLEQQTAGGHHSSCVKFGTRH
jgi:hypothetical protein